MRHGRRRARCVRSASQRRELTVTRTARYTGSPANTPGRPAAHTGLLSSRSLSRYQFGGGHLEAILACRRRGVAKNDRHDPPAAVWQLTTLDVTRDQRRRRTGPGRQEAAAWRLGKHRRLVVHKPPPTRADPGWAGKIIVPLACLLAAGAHGRHGVLTVNPNQQSTRSRNPGRTPNADTNGVIGAQSLPARQEC